MHNLYCCMRRAIDRAPNSLVRGLGFDTRSGSILLFLLPLIQEGQLSVTGESMCTKYLRGLSLPRKSVVRLTDHPDMILDVVSVDVNNNITTTILLAVGVGGSCLDVFSLVYNFSFLSPSLWETARYRLKYFSKGR